jgi:hypothetical protein
MGAIQKWGPSWQAISFPQFTEGQRRCHIPLIHANWFAHFKLKKKEQRLSALVAPW